MCKLSLLEESLLLRFTRTGKIVIVILCVFTNHIPMFCMALSAAESQHLCMCLSNLALAFVYVQAKLIMSLEIGIVC